MTPVAVRLRAATALAIAGLLVLPALLVLPPVAATVISFFVAIAVTAPRAVGRAGGVRCGG